MYVIKRNPDGSVEVEFELVRFTISRTRAIGAADGQMPDFLTLADWERRGIVVAQRYVAGQVAYFIGDCYAHVLSS